MEDNENFLDDNIKTIEENSESQNYSKMMSFYTVIKYGMSVKTAEELYGVKYEDCMKFVKDNNLASDNVQAVVNQTSWFQQVIEKSKKSFYDLLKAKEKPVGTISMQGGKKVQKQSDGSWKPVTGDKKATDEQKPDEKDKQPDQQTEQKDQTTKQKIMTKVADVLTGIVDKIKEKYSEEISGQDITGKEAEQTYQKSKSKAKQKIEKKKFEIKKTESEKDNEKNTDKKDSEKKKFALKKKDLENIQNQYEQMHKMRK